MLPTNRLLPPLERHKSHLLTAQNTSNTSTRRTKPFTTTSRPLYPSPLTVERTRANPAEAPRRLGTRRRDVEDLVDGETCRTGSEDLKPPSRHVTDFVVQKKEQKDAENAEGQAAGGKKKKVTAAQLRVQKGTTPLQMIYEICCIDSH